MNASIRKAVEYELGGVQIAPFAIMAALSAVLLVSGHLQDAGIVGAFAVMWSIGFVLYAIGEKLPIWRGYVGGGLIMAFVGTAVMVHFGWIGPDDRAFLAESVVGNRFLYFLLVALVAGSILSVDRETLLQSVLGLVPVMLCGIVGAAGAGILIGLVFQIEPARIITHYVLPVMGGGNGAGAIPMAEIYTDVTGDNAATYYGFAISILTIANMMAILMASALNRIGNRFPSLTGNGKLSRRSDAREIPLLGTESEPDPGNDPNILGAIFFTVAMLLLSMLLYALVPQIHLFAWVVVIFVGLNLANILPASLVLALGRMNEWGLKAFIVLVLVAVGAMTDLNELLSALTFENFVIAGVIVLGATLGTALSARFFSFYPVEAVIAAGLCMANRGGSGDLEVLGASRRMALFPYAQVSSRIGGGIVLFLAGYLFRIFL
ncbi:2-hydroxycarboxylate transporter family protein [Parvibaculum sp.]|uniref:2-hydroxycarboxylate transporter family protein n=1 Tax=Parvibaculum sp. TaxID=2024848 RepID=UPI000C8CB096|nr:2-hydroxycarboxylate transporter family protein [Parvibaculum sp.]MAB15015.1 hypothetical protein [Parvibaculum sp.]